MKLPGILLVLAITGVPNALFSQALVATPSAETVALAYRQKPGMRNCAGVAMTKWIIATYAPTSGPFSLQESAGVIKITLANGKAAFITNRELELATEHSKFDHRADLPDSSENLAIRHKANVLYAVLALRRLGIYDRRGVQDADFEHGFEDLDVSSLEIDNLMESLGFAPTGVDDLSLTHDGFIYGNDETRVGQVVFGYLRDNKPVYDDHGTVYDQTFAGFKSDYPAGRYWRYSLIGTSATSKTIGRECTTKKQEKWGNCE